MQLVRIDVSLHQKYFDIFYYGGITTVLWQEVFENMKQYKNNMKSRERRILKSIKL